MQSKVMGAAVGAAVASMLLAGSAAAQSNVTVYGIVDAGVEVINSSAAVAGGGGTTSRLSSGNLSGSRLGFRGTEDLGNGLKAVFALESGIAIDTGTNLQGGRTFGRQAYVGLQGKWGTLSMGRHNSLMIDWMSKYNTMDNATWSAKVHDGVFSDRLDNSIKYVGKFDAFQVGAYYSTGFDSTRGGEVRGSSKAGRQFGIGTQYTNGGFRTAAIYDQKQGHTALTEDNADKHILWGAAWKSGKTEVLGGYLWRKQEKTSTADIRTDMVWIGGRYQVSAPLQLSASIYRSDRKNTDVDPTSIITLVKYTLSKRTDLYLINSWTSNNSSVSAANTLGVNGFNKDVEAGKNQFGTMIGVRHTF